MTGWLRACSSSGNCVEVSFTDGGLVWVRDSANPFGEHLAFTADEWAAFIQGVRAGDFDLPATTSKEPADVER